MSPNQSGRTITTRFKRFREIRTLMLLTAIIAIVLGLALEIVYPIARDEIQKRRDAKWVPAGTLGM